MSLNKSSENMYMNLPMQLDLVEFIHDEERKEEREIIEQLMRNH